MRQKIAAKPDELELTLLSAIDAEYIRHPFYGSKEIRNYPLVLERLINRRCTGLPLSIDGSNRALDNLFVERLA